MDMAVICEEAKPTWQSRPVCGTGEFWIAAPLAGLAMTKASHSCPCIMAFILPEAIHMTAPKTTDTSPSHI